MSQLKSNYIFMKSLEEYEKGNPTVILCADVSFKKYFICIMGNYDSENNECDLYPITKKQKDTIISNEIDYKNIIKNYKNLTKIIKINEKFSYYSSK